MARQSYISILVALFFAFLLVSCGRNQDNTTARNDRGRPVTEVRDNHQTTRSERTRTDQHRNDTKEHGATSSEKDSKHAYEQKVQARLDEFDKRLDQIKSNLPSESDRSLATDRTLNRLEMKKDLAHSMLDHIKSADADKWQSMKPDMDQTLTDLDRSINKANIGSSTASSQTGAGRRNHR